MRIVTAAAAIVILSLAGCAALPTESPAQTSPAATPTPTVAVDPVAEVVLSTTSVQVLDSEGHLTVDAPINGWSPELLAVLTDDFGEPEVSEGQGGSHDPPATFYKWQGVTLANMHYDTGDSTYFSVGYDELLDVAARTEGGVTLQATHDELAAVAIAEPEFYTIGGIEMSAFYVDAEEFDPASDGCFLRSIYVGYDRTNDRVMAIATPAISCGP